MTGNDNARRFTVAGPVTTAIVGVSLMLFGVLLLDQAFSSAIFDRLVRHAWVAGVFGLLLLIPGAAVFGFAVQRTLAARRNPLP